MTTKAYGIVLLPDAELAAKAIRASKELEPLGTEFVLGEERNIPHASLYLVMLRTEDLPTVEQKLAAAAAKTTRLALEADQYMQAVGYIDANYIKTPAVIALHEQIVADISPLRDGLRPESAKKLASATGLAKQNIEQYGDHRIGELFRPHLTFTRFANHQPIPLEDMGAPTAFSGTFVALALCELGDHGTCVRKIQEFPLQ